MEEQLALFEQERSAADEPDAEQIETPLKYFTGLAHLLWWTFSSALKFGNYDIRYVPNHEGFDDFLCLFSNANESFDELASLLNYVENEAKEFVFGDETFEQVSNIREEVTEILLNTTGLAELSHDVERGCYLYSCMIATVDCQKDEKTYQRWIECYSTKLTEMCVPLAVTMAQYLGEQALMTPFIKRSIIFEPTRQQLYAKIQERIVADKKIFDTENDRSNIESDFQCPKCQSFKTRQYPLQMRSADEPMSTLWQCFACNKSGIEK